MAVDSAGMLLRRAREAAGLHVAALAVSLKVPVRKLEALEADRYDELTDAVFARALASTVCRTLKVDAAPILERLPQTSAPRLVQDREGLNEPFRAPGDPAGPSWADQLTRPVPLAVFGLLLAALVLVFLPGVRRDDAAPAKADAAAPPTGMTTPALPAVTGASEPVPVSAPIAADAAPVPEAAASASTPVVVAAKPAPAASRPSGAASSATVPVAAPAAQAATGAPATGLVVFRTTAPSWVEVVDARGNVTLRRLMAAGESAGATGPTPLAVTVGSASATNVDVRGKPFALAPFIVKDNVARFEIK